MPWVRDLNQPGYHRRWVPRPPAPKRGEPRICAACHQPFTPPPDLNPSRCRPCLLRLIGATLETQVRAVLDAVTATRRTS